MTDQAGQSMRDVLSICAGLPSVRFDAGEVLIPEGPSLNLLLVLVSGEVEVLRGETQVAVVSEPGAIFGEMAALLDGDHTATVRALTDVEAYRTSDAAALLKERPALAFHVARLLAQRLKDATTYLADFKRQFAHRNDHFGMVDQVLEALVQTQGVRRKAGSDLKDDPRL